jgi:hypothetical protein
MKKNKLILNYCPNFYKIINFDLSDDDNITFKLLEIYKSYIFNIDIDNKEDVETAQKLDCVIEKYLDDYFFRKDMKNRLLNIKVRANSSNFIKSIVDGIIEAFDSYEMGYTRNIYFARWI